MTSKTQGQVETKSQGPSTGQVERAAYETFLPAFINGISRLHEQNPSAIPWGGERPLSRKKLGAAADILLWGGYRFPKLSDVAGSAKHSHEVLRKWRTEPAFRRLVEWMVAQFLGGFFHEYLSEVRLISDGFERTSKDSISRKHDALAIRELARLLTYANDVWGKVLYERAFNRLRNLIQKEKNPQVVVHLYLLLLVCRLRRPRKLVINPENGKQYNHAFQAFIKQILWDWSEEHAFGSAATAKMYAEAFGAYMLLLHSKLTAPIFKHDAEVGDLALVSPAEFWQIMGWPKKA